MANTLYEYFTNQGQALPSIDQRRQMFGLGSDYRGTYQQNVNLLNQLQGQPRSVQNAVNTQPQIPTPQVAAARTYQPQTQNQGDFITYKSAAGNTYQIPNKEEYNVDPMRWIKQYFPASEWTRAYNVMMGESGGKWYAVGDDYPIKGQTIPSVGLFQIRTLPGRPDKEILMNPEENVKYAAQLWKDQGWSPWTVARELGYAGGGY